VSTSRAARPERWVVFLRHGIAEEAVAGKNDEERSLTAEGHRRMKRIARGLENLLPKVEAIYSSPLLRAVQTALWVSKGYDSRAAITTVDVLAPGAKTRDAVAFAKKIRERRAIVIGHEPNLSETVRALTGLRGDFGLKKGGACGVRFDERGQATLEWILTPRVLRKLGS
jgi:phosphohistidine phosphatase